MHYKVDSLMLKGGQKRTHISLHADLTAVVAACSIWLYIRSKNIPRFRISWRIAAAGIVIYYSRCLLLCRMHITGIAKRQCTSIAVDWSRFWLVLVLFCCFWSSLERLNWLPACIVRYIQSSRISKSFNPHSTILICIKYINLLSPDRALLKII